MVEVIKEKTPKDPKVEALKKAKQLVAKIIVKDNSETLEKVF